MHLTELRMEDIRRMKKEAKEFAASAPGNRETAWWAGRLSMAARAVIYSDTFSLSQNIAWLDAVRNEYDDAVMLTAK